jgi:hypothetical protein
MKTSVGVMKAYVATSLTLAALCQGAYGASIAPGQTISGITVAGQTSVYDIFGHAGDPGGDYGPDLPAILTTFAAGANNVFTFTATGLVSCCSDTPNIPPDGANSAMNIVGANGLSGLIGNEHIPLVGVFTTNTDPSGGSPPATLTFDASNPTSLAPLLNQVFYIGDGRSGYMDPSGTLLTFTAPASATRLYLGVIDAFGFGGVTGYYNDNLGAFTAAVTLQSVSAVPEPSQVALMLGGLGLFVAAFRRRAMRRASAAA